MKDHSLRERLLSVLVQVQKRVIERPPAVAHAAGYLDHLASGEHKTVDSFELTISSSISRVLWKFTIETIHSVGEKLNWMWIWRLFLSPINPVH